MSISYAELPIELTAAEEFTLMYLGSTRATRTEMVVSAHACGMKSSEVQRALIRLMSETDYVQLAPSTKERVDPTDVWLENIDTGEIEIVLLTESGVQAIRRITANGN